MPIHGNSKYSPEVASQVCEQIANGIGLTDACKAVGLARQTVCQWVSRHADFADAYAAARQMQLDTYADELVPIADNDELKPEDRKVRVDTRKWLLSKLRAETYGDKLDVTSAGKALAAPTHQIDARVQSIVMQAAERMRLASGLSDEAAALLD